VTLRDRRAEHGNALEAPCRNRRLPKPERTLGDGSGRVVARRIASRAIQIAIGIAESPAVAIEVRVIPSPANAKINPIGLLIAATAQFSAARCNGRRAATIPSRSHAASHTSFCNELVCTAMSGTVTIAAAASEAGDAAQPSLRNVSASRSASNTTIAKPMTPRHRGPPIRKTAEAASSEPGGYHQYVVVAVQIE